MRRASATCAGEGDLPGRSASTMKAKAMSSLAFGEDGERRRRSTHRNLARVLDNWLDSSFSTACARTERSALICIKERH